MELISNIQSSLPPTELSSIAGRAFASFGSEIDQLIAMTENDNLPVANLGANVDIKA
jgi:hypothetical protein